MKRMNANSYATIQYSTVQYSTIQYNTTQDSTIQFNTIQQSHSYMTSSTTMERGRGGWYTLL